MKNSTNVEKNMVRMGNLLIEYPEDLVAQLVFGLVYRPAHLLTSTERVGGLGSTGVEEVKND